MAFRPTSRVMASLEPPIVTTSLADEIAFRLQAAIIDGAYRPGTHLRQEEICRRFNVSRTPVREALRKLQAQNLVVMTPSKGATVRFPTRSEVRDIYVMRAELEGFACSLAIEAGINVAALRELEERQNAVERATVELEHRAGGSDQGYFFLPLAAANDRFHELIHDLAGNGCLRRMVTDLQNSFPKDLVWRAMRSLNENRMFVIDEHEAVLEALRSGDGAAACAAMSAHILHAGEVLLAYLDERKFWER